MERTVTVDGGRALQLQLHCRAVASGYGPWSYGVSSIDVLEGSALLQTVSIREATTAASLAGGMDAEFWASDDTSCVHRDGDLTVEDVNFDGAEDFRLMWYAGTVNSTQLYFLWDSEAGQFSYAFELFGYRFDVDTEARQIITEYRGDWGQYYTDSHAYDDSGTLQIVRRVHEDCGVATVYERIDGELQKVS